MKPKKSLKQNLITAFSNSPIFRSNLGRRTDNVSWEIFKNEYHLGNTLSRSEKNAIRDRWKSIVGCPLSWGYNFYEMSKALYGFDLDFIPSAYYFPYIYDVLNPTTDVTILSHKGLSGLIFNDISQPKTIAMSLGGGTLFSDSTYKPIGTSTLYELLRDRDFIIKPAKDSSMGRGVKLVRKNDPIDVKSLIDSYNSNFIIQEVVEQCEFTKALNPTSLNCMRITSINLNGVFSCENSVIKIGAPGKSVDNIGSGAGGIIIGLNNSNGTMKDFGLKADGTIITAKHDGRPFGGSVVPNYSKVLDFVKECHTRIPLIGIVGWDIALDANTNPMLIEANTYWPGITLEQLVGGTIFGTRTLEVIDYIKQSRK